MLEIHLKYNEYFTVCNMFLIPFWQRTTSKNKITCSICKKFIKENPNMIFPEDDKIETHNRYQTIIPVS